MKQDLLATLAALSSTFTSTFHINNDPVLYLMGCRSFDQFCSTLRGLLNPTEFCPFCSTERERRGRKFIARAGGWGLLENEFPHRNTEKMLLIVPIRHLVDPFDITDADWASIGRLFWSCVHEEGIVSGGLLMRYGSPLFHVGTVDHLHINVVEPKPGKEFRLAIAKNESELAEDYERLRGFIADLTKRGGKDWLFSKEGIAGTRPKVV